MKISKLKKIALMAMVGSVMTCSSVWAQNYDITIDKDTGAASSTPTGIPGVTLGTASYYIGISGGSTESGDTISSITTVSGAVDVYGINISSGISKVDFAGADSSISLTSTSCAHGINAANSKITVNNLETINLTGGSTGDSYNVYGIWFQEGMQSSEINFTESGSITVKSNGTGNDDHARGIFFDGIDTSVNIKVNDVGNILAISGNLACGYCAGADTISTNTIKFKEGSTITAKGDYESHGLYLNGGNNNITGLTSIKSGFVDSDISSSTALGIFVLVGTNKVDFAGGTSSIEAKSTGSDVYGIAFGINFGGAIPVPATGTTEITGLSEIMVETTSTHATFKNAYGIYTLNMNTDNTKKFSVSFDSTAGGSISAYSASGENCGIKFDSVKIEEPAGSGTYVEKAIGTSEVKNVKTITAGVKSGSSPEEISSGAAYGIRAMAGTNTITFTGADSSITAKSNKNDAYGISFGIRNDTAATGATTISGLGSITAERKSTNGSYVNAYGIYVKNGNTDNDTTTFSVSFDTANNTTCGNISSYSESGENIGIEFDTDDGTGKSEVKNVNKITAGVKSGSNPEEISSGVAYGVFVVPNEDDDKGVNNVDFVSGSSITAKSTGENAYGIAFGTPDTAATGTTTITGIGSITAEREDNTGDNKKAYGIFAMNGNTDNTKKFSVAFDAINGGTISAYSAAGENNGITFDGSSNGTSEVKNVKTITAGVKGSSISTGDVYGIASFTGNNEVDFKENGSITVKTNGTIGCGIYVGNGTLTVSNLGGTADGILVSGGSDVSTKIGVQGGGTLNLKKSVIKATDTVPTMYAYESASVNLSEGTKVYGSVKVETDKTLTVDVKDNTSELHVDSYSGSGTMKVTNSGKFFVEGKLALPTAESNITSNSGSEIYFIVPSDFDKDTDTMLKLKDDITIGSGVGVYVNTSALSGLVVGDVITLMDVGSTKTITLGTTTLKVWNGSSYVDTSNITLSGTSKLIYTVEEFTPPTPPTGTIIEIQTDGKSQIGGTASTYYSGTDYVGADGKVNLDAAIDQIKTVDAGVASDVYGIKVKGDKSITVTSLKDGISVKSTSGDAYGISLAGTGTNTIFGLGSITAESSGADKTVAGIYFYGEGSAFKSEIDFAGVNSKIDAKGTGQYDYTYGIFSYGRIISWSQTPEKVKGTMYGGQGNITITNLGGITVNANTGAAGIRSDGVSDDYRMDVTFADGNSGITVESATGESEKCGVYGVRVGHYISSGEQYGEVWGTRGKTSVKNLAGITVEVKGGNASETGGIYTYGDNVNFAANVEFIGAESRIKVTNVGADPTYGIRTESYGTTTVSKLGGIEVNAEGNVAYGICSSNLTETDGNVAVINIEFTGENSEIIVKSSSGSAVGVGFGKLNSTGGAITVSNLGTIAVETVSSNDNLKDAYGIFSGNSNNDGRKTTVQFVDAGGTISAYSATGDNYGIYTKEGWQCTTGITEVKNVKSISAGVKSDGTITTGVAYGISATAGVNTVTFTGAESSITAKSSAGYVYGLYLSGGTNTISDIGSIKTNSTGSAMAYGIYTTGGKNTISFKGNNETPTQAITAKGSDALTSCSISATGGSTTVNFENSILSGKVKQSGDSTLTLNFNDGGVWKPTASDITGNVNVNVNAGGTIDTRATTTATKTINLGTGTFTATTKNEGETTIYPLISFDAWAKSDNTIVTDTITVGVTGGTIKLGTVNVKDEATAAWTTAKEVNLFNATTNNITITGKEETQTSQGWLYTFEGEANGKVSVKSEFAPHTLPDIIQGSDVASKKISAYSLTANEALAKDLGTLDNSERTSGLTIYGNSKTISKGTANNGTVTLANSTDKLTVTDLTVSGFTKFADNAGTLNLSGVTFTGTTGNDVITGTGKTVISGVVTADKNIAQQVEVQDGANLIATGISVNGTGEVKGISANMTVVDDSATASVGSITVESSDGKAYGIWAEGKGTTTVSNLGSIAVDSNIEKAYGISMMNTNDASAANPEFLVSFVTTGGSINAYSAASDNFGIYYSYDNTGKTEVKNVKTIKAGVATTGGSISSSYVYGIYSVGGVNTVDFTGAGSSIEAKSTDGEAYGLYAMEGTLNVTDLEKITAISTSSYAEGISTYGGTNTVTFSGAGSSIEAKSDSGIVYGIYSLDGVNTVTFAGADSFIGAQSTDGYVCGVEVDGGTLNVDGLKKLSATSTSGKVDGICTEGGSTTVAFTGTDSKIEVKSLGGSAFGIDACATDGGLNVTGLGSITAETTGAAPARAYGIYAKAGVNTVQFTEDGGSVFAKSTSTGAIGIKTEDGTNNISNLKSVSVVTSANTGSMYAEGVYFCDGTNTITFTGADSSITVTATGTAADVYGIDSDEDGTNTISNLGSITVKTAGSDKSAYGICMSEVGGANTISFKGNGGQAITATNTANPANAYSIYAKGGTGTTTVNFENSILSGKIHQEGTATLNLNFNDKGVWKHVDGDVTGNVNVTVKNGGTIDTRSRDAQGEVTTAAVKTIDLGTGTFTAQSGSKISFDAVTADSGLTTDTIKTTGTVGGTIALGSVNVTDTATAEWKTAKTANLFVNGTGAAQTGIEITGTTKTTTKDYEYTFTGGTSGVVSATSKSVKVDLPSIIKGDNDVKTFSLTDAETKMEEDMGELNMKNRDSFTIAGNGNTLDVNGKGGIQVTENNGKKGNLTVSNTVVKGFDKFVTNAEGCTVTLNNITFFENTEKDVLDVENKGTMYVEGTTTFNNGIGGDGTIVIKENANVYYNKEVEQSFSNNVIVGKDATLDPVVSVFAEGVNVQVNGGGTLVLQPGTLFANIHQDAGSVLKVAAEDIKTTTFLTGVDTASQLNVKNGTLTIEGAEKWGYYSLVSGKAVTDGTLKPDDLWLVDETLKAQGFESEYDVKDGVVTLEFRNIPLAVETNTSALAGVQQGAITMVNQIADVVGENVGIIARPAQDGVYDKTIWANYINSKETVNGMSMWRGNGDNTAKYHGVTVGADFYTTKKAIAGVALTYVTGDVTSNPSDTHINNKTKYYGISFYDRVTNGKGAWTYDLGYSQGKNEISQNSYQTVTADAKTNAYTLGAKYEYAYNFKHSSLVPFASLRYLRLNSKDYSNSNGHNMSINNQNLIVPKLGLAWTGNFEMPKSNWTFKPVAEVGYIWNLKGREAEGTFTTRNSAYSLQYDTVDKSSYYTKLGLNFNKKNFTGGVSYRYAKGDAARQNSWNVNLSWSF